MSRSSLVGGICVVLVFASLANAAVAGSKEDVEAINKVREMEAASINEGSPDNVSRIYTKDVEYIPPGEVALQGTDAVRKWVATMIEQADVDLEYTSSEVKVLGDWAIEQYGGVVTMTPKAGGESKTENLRGIHVYRRGEDGAWKISHDIWSADKPHPGAE